MDSYLSYNHILMDPNDYIKNNIHDKSIKLLLQGDALRSQEIKSGILEDDEKDL